jgi:hypothetical protein
VVRAVVDVGVVLSTEYQYRYSQQLAYEYRYAVSKFKLYVIELE